ncbi:hypothetical protein Droror1_Dr00017114 [Drosera rotundifolia]
MLSAKAGSHCTIESFTIPAKRRATCSMIKGFSSHLHFSMELGAARRRTRKFSSYNKPAAIVLTFLAILSPIYIDRRRVPVDPYSEEQPLNFAILQPLFLLVLTTAVALSCYIDHGSTRFDPYWIHRFGGSPSGIFLLLALLVLILRCKASVNNHDS